MSSASSIDFAPYWGSLDFWHSVKEGKVALRADVRYSSLGAGLLNRTLVQDSHGKPHLLSFPIKGGRKNKQPLTDVEIDFSTPWQKQHLATLQSCYGRCLFWEEYHMQIKSLLMSSPRFLLEFNRAIYLWTSQFVQLPRLSLLPPHSPQITHTVASENYVPATNGELSILHFLMYRF